MKKLLFLISLVLLFAACKQREPCKQETSKIPATVIQAWIKAEKTKTIEAYKDFIDKYSCNDSLVKIAQQKIDSLQQEQDWQAIKESENIEDFRAFCRKYPYSYHHTEAYRRVNHLLLNQLDSKYAVITDFFRQVGKSNNQLDVVKQYATNDFCIIKSRKYHEQDWAGDTLPLDKITETTINPRLLKVCDSLFTPENLLNKYELICDTNAFRIKFTTSCGTVLFSWIPQGNTFRLKCVEIKQDYCY